VETTDIKTQHHLTALQTLHLSSNQLGSEGGEALGASMHDATALRVLDPAFFQPFNRMGSSDSQELRGLLSHVFIQAEPLRTCACVCVCVRPRHASAAAARQCVRVRVCVRVGQGVALEGALVWRTYSS